MNDTVKVVGKVRLQVIRGVTRLDRFKLKYFSNTRIGRYLLDISPANFRVLEDTGFQQNLVTNTGKAAIAGLVGNTGAITAFTYLGLGITNTAAAVTDTTLASEIVTNGLSRSQATITRTTTSVANDTLNFDFTWTASGASTIAEVGIFNASSSGIMLARKVLSSTVTSTNGNSIRGTYTVQFT